MKQRITPFLAIFWCAVLFSSYLKVFPFSSILKELSLPPLPLIGLHTLTSLLVLVLLLISASGYGRIFWKIHFLTHLERFVFSIAGGLGILSVIFFLLAAAGIIYKPVFLFILFLGIVQFFLSANKVHTVIHKDLFILSAFALAPFLLSLAGALAPPTQFDSLVYHLSLPAHYIRHGALYHVQDNFFFSFPQGLEMLFLGGMVIDSDILANLIHWVFFPLTMAMVFMFAKRFFNPSTAFISSIIFSTTPLVIFLSSGTYIDLGLMFYIFASLFSVIIWQETKSRHWLYFAAFFGGIALSFKYTAAIPLSIFLVLVIYFSDTYKDIFKNTFIFTGVSAVIFLPWLIKNAVFLKNPFSPWGADLFKNSFITPDSAAAYFSHISSHGLPLDSIKAFLLLPWNLTANGAGYGGGLDVIGPAFILFIPLLFLNFSFGKIEKILLIFVLSFTLFWLSTGKVLRFLAPLLPMLSILSAAGLVKASETKLLKPALWILLASLGLHNLMLSYWVMLKIDPFPVAFGREDRNLYLSRKINSYNSLFLFVNTLPKGSKALSWGETRSYYFNIDNITPTVFDVNPLETILKRSGTDSEAFVQLADMGITHLFLNKFEDKRLQYTAKLPEKEQMIFAKLLKTYSRAAFEDKYCTVYELKPRANKNGSASAVKPADESKTNSQHR